MIDVMTGVWENFEYGLVEQVERETVCSPDMTHLDFFLKLQIEEALEEYIFKEDHIDRELSDAGLLMAYRISPYSKEY